MKVYAEDYSVRGLDYALVLVLIKLSASFNLPIQRAEIGVGHCFFLSFWCKIETCERVCQKAMPAT